MKRRRRIPQKRPSNLHVEADVATGTTAPRSRARSGRHSTMKLPHERDEDAQAPRTPNPVTKQGARDVEQGKVDTDCYGAAGERFDRTRGRG